MSKTSLQNNADCVKLNIMFSDKIFSITLIVSILVHGAILLQNPHLNPFMADKKSQKISVRYLKEKNAPLRPISTKKDVPLRETLRIDRSKTPPPPFVDKENIFRKENLPVFSKNTFAKPVIGGRMAAESDMKRKITLPALPTADISKINNPSYLGYYQFVREKIRRAAYQNHTRSDTGETHLFFVITKDGYIKEVNFNQEKSSNNPYLKDVSLRSVKDASPFPPFPKELSYPQLSFDVIISFAVEQE